VLILRTIGSFGLSTLQLHLTLSSNSYSTSFKKGPIPEWNE
jgi:hypothetical protein